MKLYNLLLFLHILHYLNIALQIIIDLQLLILQTTQIELTELQYTIQKNDPCFPILTERFITKYDLLYNKKRNRT